MRAVIAVITGGGISYTLCITPSMRKRIDAVLAARLEVDVARALVEGVLQQPVDDVHDVASLASTSPPLPSSTSCSKLRMAADASAPGLGVLRQLDRTLDAVKLLQIAVDVDRA